jgi:hypothetical protein
MKQRPWLTLTLVVTGVVLLAFGTAGPIFLYMGPMLPDTDDEAELRRLGAQAWRVQEPGEWEPVADLLRRARQAEADAVAATPRLPDAPDERHYWPEYTETDPRRAVRSYQSATPLELELAKVRIAIAAQVVEEMRNGGIFSALRPLAATAPVYAGSMSVVAGDMPTYSTEDAGNARVLARAMRTRLQLAIDGTAEDEQIDAFADAMALSRILANQPGVLPALHHGAIESMLLNAAAEAAMRGRLSREVAEAWVDEVARQQSPSIEWRFEATMLEQRLFIRSIYPSIRIVPFSDAAQYAPYERLYKSTIEALRVPWPESRRAMIEAEERARARWPRQFYMVTSEGQGEGPIVSHIFGAFQLGLAVRRGAYLALALESHRLATGNFPESLDAIANQLPPGTNIDPYGNGPFRYTLGDDPSQPAIAGGCIVYSVGFDGIDGGGHIDTSRPHNGFSEDHPGLDVQLVGPNAYALPMP